jgi:hypothetical protein
MSIRRRPVSLILVGLFIWVTACSTYTYVEPGEVADHGKVRVTTSDGEREAVYEPWVRADTIRGRSRQNEARAIPMDQVVGLEAVGKDYITPLVILGLVVLAVGAVTFIKQCSETDFLC